MYWNRVYIVSVPLLLIIIHFFHSCCNKLDLAVLSFSSRLSRCLLAVSSSSFLVWRSRSSRWFFRRSCLSASSEVSAASAAVLYRTTWEQMFSYLIARLKSWRMVGFTRKVNYVSAKQCREGQIDKWSRRTTELWTGPMLVKCRERVKTFFQKCDQRWKDLKDGYQIY